MCTVCGCGTGQLRIGQASATRMSSPTRAWRPRAGADADPPGDQASAHRSAAASDRGLAGTTLDYGSGPAGAHAPGLSQRRMVNIERDILGKNDRLATANRQRFAERGIFTLNLLSSPGSGKTTLLCRSIAALCGEMPIAVIEGDQQTDFDAERIRATGVAALQINTGKGCHLDAQMIAQALPRLALADGSLLLIENVGNLVCPAAFDLGEARKVVILSVTEGEDKPLKYPDMFAAADLLLLNKIDLLPYVDFDADKAIEFAHRINPQLATMRVSARSGEGFDAWLGWLREGWSRTAAGTGRQLQAER